MSMLNKLLIHGIRSFGPDDPQVIQFLTPLTIIVGPNGSGKTTVIESLKYATTGDMPPGAKGSLFIHDPKLAEECEVKAQIKLQFRDVTGQNAVVTRSLVSTQRQKKVETKTLEGTIKRMSRTGEGVSLSSKCAEIDREMITSLGVSKAVLTNVIFCHQEDSCWPLSEGKNLKCKFDDIFAATRYIKALDSIRKLRLEQNAEIKTFQTELKYLTENKDRADELKNELQKNQVRLKATQDEMRRVNEKLKPVEQKIATIQRQRDELQKMITEIEKLKSQATEIERSVKELRAKMKNPYDGTLDELEHYLGEYQGNLADKKRSKGKLELQMAELVEESSQLQSDKSRMLQEQGKLEAEHEHHKRRLLERDGKIVTCCRELDITGFDGPSFSDDDIKRFRAILSNKGNELMSQAEDLKTEFKSKTKALQANIDNQHKAIATAEESIRLKTSHLTENKAEIEQARRSLKDAEASTSRLNKLSSEIEGVKKRITSKEGELDTASENRIMNKLKSKQDVCKAKLSTLSAEWKDVQADSQKRTELSLWEADKSEKETKLRNLNSRHNEALVQIFNGIVPDGPLSDKVFKYQSDEEQELRRLQKQIEAEILDESKVENEKKLFQDQLRKKQNEVEEFETKLLEVSGSQEMDTAVAENDVALKKTKDELAVSQGSQYVYKKFVDILSSSSKAPCPVCQRNFSNKKELHDCKSEISVKLQQLPKLIKGHTEKMNRYEERQRELLLMLPTQTRIGQLKKEDIPELEKKIRSLSTRLGGIKNRIRELTETKSDREITSGLASGLINDVKDMDRLAEEVDSLDQKMLAHKSKLGSHGGSTRTPQRVQKDMEANQTELDKISNDIDARKKSIEDHERSILKMKQELNNLESERLLLCRQVEKLTQLTDRIDSVTKANDDLEQQIATLKGELGPMELSLKKLQTSKSKLESENDTRLKQFTDEIEQVRRHGSDIQDALKETKAYMKAGKEGRLHQVSDGIKQLMAQIDDVEKEKNEIRVKLEELQMELSNSEARYRELDDDRLCRRKTQELEKLRERITIKGKDLKIDIDSQNTFSELQEEYDRLTREKNIARGREDELDNTVERLEADLRQDSYKNAEKRYKDKVIELKTTEVANSDLQKYYKALDTAIMRYHSLKMEEINKIVKELWQQVYRSNDIDWIEIKSDEDCVSGGSDKRRVYNYRVVMIRNGVELDMRGRCSAGQKVLASLIIRIALAETFCLNCGILALDEPTTNLDQENIRSLATALIDIVQGRAEQKNFQLIVITHDEDFVELLLRAQMAEAFYRVQKNESGHSTLIKEGISQLER